MSTIPKLPIDAPTNRAADERADRLAELSQAVWFLRRAVREKGRIDVETFCSCVRLRAYFLEDMQQDAIGQAVNAIEQLWQHGACEELRKLTLGGVAWIENILEAVE
jgi:hypothetical protein